MTELKTKQNNASVVDFLSKSDQETRKDCYRIIGLMEKVTGEKAKMWGSAIVGCGQYHYRYASGHEGDICKVGFSPRKGKITLYVLAGAQGQGELLGQLGKHKAGKGCLYIKKLDDIDMTVLEKIMRETMNYLEEKFKN